MSVEKIKSSRWTALVAMIVLLVIAGTGNVAVADAVAGEYQFTAEEQATIDRFIAKHGDDVEAVDEESKTLLHKAVYTWGEQWDVEVIIKFLVSKGADFNARDNGGLTPLHRAARWLNKRSADALITAGANVNARDNNGMTPLHLAVRSTYIGDSSDDWAENGVDVVKFLVSKGANVHAKNNNGKTPLDLANEGVYDIQETIEFLINVMALTPEIEIPENNIVRRVVQPRRLFRLLPGIFRLR